MGDGGGIARNLVGVVEGVRYEERDGRAGLFGTYKVAAPWMRELLRGAWQLGRETAGRMLGFSIDAKIRVDADNNVIAFGPHPALDAVSQPAAGGELLRAVAAIEGDPMDTFVTHVTEALAAAGLNTAAAEHIQDRWVQASEAEGADAEVLTAAFDAEIEAVKLAAAETAPEVPAAEAVSTPAAEPPQTDIALMLDVREAITDRLAASGLKARALGGLRDRLRGQTFESVQAATEATDAAITGMRELLAEAGAAPEVTGQGEAREATAGADRLDNLQAGMDGMLAGKAVKPANGGKPIQPFRSIREAVLQITGKSLGSNISVEEVLGLGQGYVPPNYNGAWNGAAEAIDLGDGYRRVEESIITSTFAQILGDSVTRKMRAEYNLASLQMWRLIVSEFASVSDFRTQRRPAMGGYGTLPAVAQGANYLPLTSPADAEETYTIGKFGGTEDVTMETLLGDDVGALRRVPRALGRAASQTLLRDIMDLVTTDNPTMNEDSTALYHADHSNTGTAALSGAALRDAKNAMRSQTAYGDTSEILGEMNQPKFIIVPNELADQAEVFTSSRIGIMEPDATAAMPADANATVPNLGWIRNLVPIVYDVLTDDDAWFLVADPGNIPTVEVGFLNGRQEPELFTQDQPTVGSVFTADKITYKVRHIWGFTVLDWRAFYRQVP